MPRRSAGILFFRRRPEGVQVLLVHPGGPFWKKKDLGAWSIPKGEIEAEEEPLAAARREVKEELGFAPEGPFIPLSPCKLKDGKIVLAWACECDWDTAELKSNTFTMEWPPRSGRRAEFPEVDRAEWFALAEAREKINVGQVAFIDDLERVIPE